MKISLGISNFLEGISSLSHSVIFLYFFALIAEEGFLISPCYSLELCIQMGIAFVFPVALTFLLFIAVCKAFPDNLFAFLFLGDHPDHCLLYNVPNLCPKFFRHSARSHHHKHHLHHTFTVTIPTREVVCVCLFALF